VEAFLGNTVYWRADFGRSGSVSALEVGGPEGHREDVPLGKGMHQDLLLVTTLRLKTCIHFPPRHSPTSDSSGLTLFALDALLKFKSAPLGADVPSAFWDIEGIPRSSSSSTERHHRFIPTSHHSTSTTSQSTLTIRSTYHGVITPIYLLYPKTILIPTNRPPNPSLLRPSKPSSSPTSAEQGPATP
jgi:hypothetical protein